MKRSNVRLFVVSAIGAALTAGSCGDSSRGPTAPTIREGPTAPTTPTVPIPPGVPPKPSGPTYTIAGMVSEYRGGPLSGAHIVVFSCNRFWGIACDTQTDVQGHYSIDSPSMEPTDVRVWKPGYQSAWKTRVSVQNATASFVLHPSVGVSAFGATIKGTIRGDEFIGGDDVLFGGLCVHTPCKVMEFGNFIGPPRQAEIRLRWADSTHQLALYKFEGDPDSISSEQPAARYCCTSEIVATISVGGYFDAIAVAFEQAGGGPPKPADSQSFELTVRPIP